MSSSEEHILYAVMNHKRFQYVWGDPGRKYDGHCDPPSEPSKKIILRPSLKRNKRRLATILIHEGLHAQGWHIDEEFVERAAEELVRVMARFDLIKE